MGHSGIIAQGVTGVPMKTLTLGLVLASAIPVVSQDARPSPDSVDTFNYILGTQTIGVKYGFTDKTRLVETAERIHQMGSNILKICMGKTYPEDYSLPKRGDVRSLMELAKNEPSFKAVLDMPFAYTLIWAYGFSPGWWADGFSQEERDCEYREMYDLAAYLLKQYAESGAAVLRDAAGLLSAGQGVRLGVSDSARPPAHGCRVPQTRIDDPSDALMSSDHR